MSAGVDVIAPGPVHAIDGDGSSLCDAVESGLLAHVDHYSWSDIGATERCPVCGAIMAGPDS